MNKVAYVIFWIVAHALKWVASITGFTYNEINIIAYYIVLPFVYVALFDRILKKHFLKVAYVIVWAVILIYFITDFRVFSDVLFEFSVAFLRLFDRFGLNYVEAAVLVCVVLPGLVFAVLCVFAFPSLRHRLFAR